MVARSAMTTLLLILTGVAGYQLYFLLRRRSGLAAELASVVSRTEKLNRENRQLKADIAYFSGPENFIKELPEK